MTSQINLKERTSEFLDLESGSAFRMWLILEKPLSELNLIKESGQKNLQI